MEAYRIQGIEIPATNIINTRKKQDKFIKGPIPMSWISMAAKLPGKTLHVGLVLWYLSGLTCKRTVKLSGSILQNFGISRQATYRCLEYLQNAELVVVEKHSGRCPVVTINSGKDHEK